MRHPARLLALVAVCWTATAADEAAIKEDLAGMGQAVETLLERREAAIADLPAEGGWTLDLEFPLLISRLDRWGNLKKSHLEVRLLVGPGGRCHALAARTPEWYRAGRHRFDVAGLAREGDRLHGEVRVHLQPRRGKATRHFRDMRFAMRIDCRVGKEAVRGAYATEGIGRWPVAPREGEIVGRRVELGAGWKDFPPEPQETLTEPMHVYYDRVARWHELRGTRAYADLRAAAIARSHGLDLRQARFLVPAIRPRWPALPEQQQTLEGGDGGGDDLGGLLDEIDGGGGGGGADGEALGELAPRIAAQRAALERCVAAASAEADAPIVGGAENPDPAFGPFYGEAVLPESEAAAHALPDDAGADGEQAWASVARWRVLGPLEQGQRIASTPAMPEVIPVAGGRYPLPVEAFAGALEKRKMGLASPAELGDATFERGTGFVRLPQSVEYESEGHSHHFSLSNARFYAFTEVAAAEDVELWAGITVADHGELWMDDQLVWKSPLDPDARPLQRTYLVRLPFHEGINRLAFRSDNDDGDGYFGLRLCLRGGPRDAGTAAAAEAAIAEARAAAGDPMAGVVGWRYDLSGRFPDCDPPLAWDFENDLNVRWHRKMRTYSHASPLIVGDACYVSEEPHTLVCLDKASGEVRWRRHCDVLALHDDDGVRKRSAEIQQAIDALHASGSSDSEELEELRRERKKLQERHAEVRGPSWKKSTGQTIATPTSDGEAVYVKYNTGVLARVGPDGAIDWMIAHGASTEGCSHHGSPILLGDHLIVLLQLDARTRQSTKQRFFELRAYDKASGELRWTGETSSYGWICGTPVVARLTDGAETMDVIVTPNGAVFRAEDGELLLSDIGHTESYGTPVVDGDRVFFGPNGWRSCVRLRMLDRDRIGAETVWKKSGPRHFQDGNYALILDDALYAFRPGLDVLDADDGDFRHLMEGVLWERTGRAYPPIAEAGGTLFVADNGTWFSPRRHSPGGMSAIAPGNPPRVLARNKIPKMNGAPTFDGERLYLRGFEHLYCFAVTGEEGAAYQARVLAREAMRDMDDGIPPAGEVVTGLATVEVPGDGRGADFRPGRIPDRFLFAGPAAPGDAEALVAALAEVGRHFHGADAEQRVAVGGGELPVRSLHGRNRDEWRAGDAGFRCPDLMAGDGERVGCFATVIWNDYPRTVRVEAPDERVRMRVGGVAVEHGDYLALPAGHLRYQVIVQETEVGNDALALARARLLASRGPDADRERWLDRLARIRSDLARVVELAPESAEGRRAAGLLAQGR